MDLQEEQIQKLEQYLSGAMDASTKEAFELEIDTTPELKEFLDIFHGINNLEDETTWPVFNIDPERLKEVVSILNNKETQQFSENIKQQRQKMAPATKQPKNPFFKRIVFTLAAACVALVLYLTLPKNDDLTSLYSTYNNWEELPSVVVKGAVSESQKLAVETAFKEQQFEKTIELSNQIINASQKTQINILLYKGASFLALNKYDEAITTFNLVLQSDSIDNHKAYWYKAMVYLKMEDKEKTILALKEVISKPDNYKFKEAEELLNILE